jgi:Ca2+-binding RTX toxin-like protein
VGPTNGSAVIMVTDFTPGAGGDQLGIGTSDGILSSLSGWDGSANPFGAGFLRLVQNGADTDLQWDQNGPTGGMTYTTLVHFQNTNAGDFTSGNFSPGYSPDGDGIAGQTLAGSGTVNGTIGDDTISGSSGADRLIGGAGADTLTGGFGADTFVFNFPSDGLDIITDFVSGSNTPAGDHLEFSASLFGGGLTAGGAAPLVTATDVASALSSGTDGYFIFDNAGANAGTVYWDQNGGAGTDAVAITVLTGITSLASSDFHLV